MVIGIVGVIAIVTIGWPICFGLCELIGDITRRIRRPTPKKRVAQTYRAAAGQVDDAFAQARIRMEEAAGWRQPGEQRIGDGIRGSWHRW